MSEKLVTLESGGTICMVINGNLFEFTDADRKLLSTIADAILEHEGPAPEKETG